jgi:hypothetical protein
MAKALAAQSQSFEQAAGIWGPGFSDKLMNSMKIMAHGRGGHEMVKKMMDMVQPLLDAGPEGMARRAALLQGKGPQLHENMSQQDQIQWIMNIIGASGSHSAFQSPTTRKVTGDALLSWGSGSEFQTGQTMRERLKGHSAASLTADLERLGGDMSDLAGDAGQGADQLLSTKLANLVNPWADVLPEAITIVTKSLDGLAETAAGLSDKFAGWLKGKANQGAGLLATGITSLRGGSAGVGGMLSGLLSGGGGMLSGATSMLGKGLDHMGAGGDFLKSGWKVLSNSVMLLVKAFTEGGVFGALGGIIKGFWDWLVAALPHYLKGTSELLGAHIEFWVANFSATVEHLMASAFAWGDYFLSVLNTNMEMLWADISRSTVWISDTGKSSQEIFNDAYLKSEPGEDGFYEWGGITDTRDSAIGDADTARKTAMGRANWNLEKTERIGRLGLGPSPDMQTATWEMTGALLDLKDAFNKGPQAERLQNIETGLEDMGKVAKDAWEVAVAWYKNN